MKFIRLFPIFILLQSLPNKLLFSQEEIKKNYDLGVKHLYTNYDSSEYYFEKAINDFTSKNDREFLINSYNLLFVVNFFKGDFVCAEKWILEGFTILEREKELITNKALSDYYNNISVYYSTISNSRNAIYFLKECLKLELSIADEIVVKSNLAREHNSLKDYILSDKIFSQMLEKVGNFKKEVPKVTLIELYISIGDNFVDMGNLESGLVFYEKGYKLVSSIPNNVFLKEKKVLLLARIIAAKVELRKVYDISNYLMASNYLLKNKKLQYHFRMYNALAKLKEHQKDYPAAKEAYQQAIKEVHIQHDEFTVYDVIARQYIDLIALEYKMGSFQEALATSQKGLSHTAANVDLNDLLSFPDTKNVLYKGEALKILTLKAKILQALYKQSNDSKELQAAYDTYQLAAELAKLIRQDIMTQGSKQKLAGDVLPIYEGGIETALALFELTGDSQYKDAAFQFAESNKAILLLESMNDNDAKNYSGIPDSLLEKDNELRIEIAFYEKNISQEQSKKGNIDQDKIKQWKSTLFDLNAEHQDLIELLEKDYPKYVDLKYNTKLATPQELQSNLIGAKDALLEYFIGEENIYAFLITKDNYEIVKIDKPENFQENIDLFLFHTKRPSKSDTDFRLVLETQHDYYVKYVQPAISKLSEKINRLIIIPDDVFNYIPFEIFITSPIPLTDVPFSPKKHDYLFEEYIMTYNYSATLFQKSFEASKKEKAEKMLLAMAPEFNKNAIASNTPTQRACTIFDIYDLACSGQEVKEIATQMKGDYFVGFDADKNTFEQMAKNYRILHLATHSCPDENNPNFSKIFLSDEAITNYDLLNYEFNADLAVLSACNTGFGKLVKGEGVMPLSKGFIQAGIPSTVMSLWPVDDCGTSKIMKLFYKYLDQGLPKDEALQKAKLEFIDISNMVYQHPYYWSAFIHMGNFEPIHEKSKIPPIAWWIGGALLAFGIFQFGRKKLAKAA